MAKGNNQLIIYLKWVLSKLVVRIWTSGSTVVILCCAYMIVMQDLSYLHVYVHVGFLQKIHISLGFPVQHVLKFVGMSRISL